MEVRVLRKVEITSHTQKQPQPISAMSDNEGEVHYAERERSRSRDRSNEREYRGGDDREQQFLGEDDDGNNFNMYITNINQQTTDDVLKAAFEKIGEVASVSIIREPVTKVSRGFGFLEMTRREDSIAAIETLNGADIDGNKIRVERARRRGGYGKSPGVYLGPPQFSSKYCRERRDGGRDGGGRDYRGGGGGDRRDRGGDRDRGGGDRDRGERRYPREPMHNDRLPSRDFYAREDERLAALTAYRTAGPADLYPYDRIPLYRDDPRYVDPRLLDRRDVRFDARAGLPPDLLPPSALYDVRGGAALRGIPPGAVAAAAVQGRRGRSPMGMDERRLPVGYDRVPPREYYRRSPSPSRRY